MTEQEYLDATNLAKVRVAISIVRDATPFENDEQDKYRKAAIAALDRWERSLNKAIGDLEETP